MENVGGVGRAQSSTNINTLSQPDCSTKAWSGSVAEPGVADTTAGGHIAAADPSSLEDERPLARI